MFVFLSPLDNFGTIFVHFKTKKILLLGRSTPFSVCGRGTALGRVGGGGFRPSGECKDSTSSLVIVKSPSEQS